MSVFTFSPYHVLQDHIRHLPKELKENAKEHFRLGIKCFGRRNSIEYAQEVASIYCSQAEAEYFGQAKVEKEQ